MRDGVADAYHAGPYYRKFAWEVATFDGRISQRLYIFVDTLTPTMSAP